MRRVSSSNQLADGLTKKLTGEGLETFRRAIEEGLAFEALSTHTFRAKKATSPKTRRKANAKNQIHKLLSSVTGKKVFACDSENMTH